jgi:pyruvate/2-oxoglutarate dehydrogenase complex dihydrolipoamide dehydrogenase (E3) component
VDAVTADVVVIGSGQAGVPLADRLARAGRRVVLIERGDLGGTCVNTGCTPTKTMVASARAAHVARRAGRLGVHVGPVVDVDLRAVVARKDGIVRQWRDGVAGRLQRAGPNLTLVRGHARFTGPHVVEAAGAAYESPTIVINVGCRPAAPPLSGLDTVPWLDNARAMDLVARPDHLLVLGGGYIGCEFAQMFRRFGSRVTVVDVAPRLLAQEDPDVSAALEGVFRDEGLDLVLGARPQSAAAGPGRVTLHLDGGATVEGSHLLVATGRRPNTDDLGLDRAGVATDPRGYVPVDDRYGTNVEGVYAVGDVAPGPQFTHTSWDDHRILFNVLQGRPARKRSDRVVPITAFTDPQVARVGLTETEARSRGACDVATMPFGHVARAIETGETAGLLKVIAEPGSGRLLGAAVVGAEAGELIHVFVAALAGNVPVRALVDAEYVHPTFAEGLQSVLMRLPGYGLD